ncbi:MAG: DUF4350 domain-containing protein [Deltaproteobacteria bacterium]|nr:DUF4350 domain-containing protein [Deltaproteobacteria bacterium]
MKRALAIATLVLGTATAAAQPADYDPFSQSWNGMSSFVGLAEGMGFEVTAVGQLEWGELSANDVLVLIYPLQRVDPGRLGAFVQAGGNVIIADDFGEGKEAMQELGLLRVESTPPQAASHWKGHLHAPIATASGDHPVAADVGEVITNHPATLTRVEGVSTIAGFPNGAVIVAGERGSGRFVAVSDPSIFINKMLLFRGNVQVATNMLRWLDRGRRARHVVLLRGDVPMYGEPRAFIDDARAGELGRSIANLNFWLSQRREWLLTPAAMKALAAALAIVLLLLAMVALPVRRGPRIDGAWLRFGRPGRRDEPHGLVREADRGTGSNLVLACILRDHVQVLLAGVTGKTEPLYTLSETHLVNEVSKARGTPAGTAVTRLYRRLRALPSRGQASAPWSAGHLARRDFDILYRDVAELCRTLGSELPADPAASQSSISPSSPRSPRSENRSPPSQRA